MTAVAIAPLAAARTDEYIGLAALLATIMGLVCIAGYFAKLGFLADLLSKPVLIGYMAGIALIMIGGQIGKIAKIEIEANMFFPQISEFVSKFSFAHIPTLILGIAVLVFLFAFQRRFPNAPIPLIAVLATDILVGVGIAVSLSVIELFYRVARPHDAILGTVPDLAGFHDVDDWEGAETIPGLLMYRYDAPLCFANAENFKERVLEAIALESTPVSWLILNMEANVEIDITAIDMLAELRDELAAKNITFALARVKQDLYIDLKKAQFLNPNAEHIYPTLRTAIAAFERRKL